jgi:hypothetical protein
LLLSPLHPPSQTKLLVPARLPSYKRSPLSNQAYYNIPRLRPQSQTLPAETTTQQQSLKPTHQQRQQSRVPPPLSPIPSHPPPTLNPSDLNDASLPTHPNPQTPPNSQNKSITATAELAPPETRHTPPKISRRKTTGIRQPIVMNFRRRGGSGRRGNSRKGG